MTDRYTVIMLNEQGASETARASSLRVAKATPRVLFSDYWSLRVRIIDNVTGTEIASYKPRRARSN